VQQTNKQTTATTATTNDERTRGGRRQRATAAIQRMFVGLQALGRVSVVGVPVSAEFPVPSVGGALVSPGLWCVDAPLWRNLFAPAPPPATATAAGPRGHILPRGLGGTSYRVAALCQPQAGQLQVEEAWCALLC
jgi:hypothetical protein